MSRALFLLVKRCLFLLQTTKREKKRMKKNQQKLRGVRKKRRKPKQNSTNWEQSEVGAKAEPQSDRGL